MTLCTRDLASRAPPSVDSAFHSLTAAVGLARRAGSVFQVVVDLNIYLLSSLWHTSLKYIHVA